MDPTANARAVAILGLIAAQRVAALSHALPARHAAAVKHACAHPVNAKELARSAALNPDVPLLCQLGAACNADANAASHASPGETAALRTGAAAPSQPEVSHLSLDS